MNERASHYSGSNVEMKSYLRNEGEFDRLEASS